MLGGYLQSDPIGLAGGLNTYGYVGSNPLNFMDPTDESALAGVGTWIATDAVTPDPSDVVWPK